MAFVPEDFDAQPNKDEWRLIGSTDKPIVKFEFNYGVLIALHPDGTHSLFVTPEDRANLTGKLQ